MSKKTYNFDPRKDSIKLLYQRKGSNFTTIDFNYPSLNRKDLESNLSVINDKSRPFKKLGTNRDWSLNLYNLDIEGACPRKFSYFLNKADFINKNNDIEKSSPKHYYPFTNKASFNLTNDDIEFSKPQCNKNASNRHTNPLTPKYTTPKLELLPIPVPKFIRNSIDIKDIEGSEPNKLGFNKNLFKNPITKEQIMDSYAKKPYLRKTKYEYMDYRDVTKNKIIYRNTNPLRPQYKWNYTEDKKILGSIDGNAPLVYGKFLYKNPFNLRTKDIEGSNTGSKCPILKYKGNTYYLKTKDIYGAQGDTLIRGIITKRHINPINPKYQYLGHSEIQNIDNNPYFIDFNNNKKNENDNSNNIDEKKILNKIKIINKENSFNDNNTLNENTAMKRKLLINKFYGHLNHSKSNSSMDFNTDYKNKIKYNSYKLDKLKNQLKPLNKRNSFSVKNSSTIDAFKLNNFKFIGNKTEAQNKVNKNNYTSLVN